MHRFRICHQGIVAGWLLLAACLPVSANLAETMQTLPDGQYIFASRLPDKSKNPDIQLAGAEIVVFEKTNNDAIGERFIANSSELNCFQGKLAGNTLLAEALDIPYDQSIPTRFAITVNLSEFKIISLSDINYAKTSIQRCRQQFKRNSVLSDR